ncbi:MAG: hypothetical protein LBQ94_04090 [Treponema sp.]|jgi:hypothetical protein|nr:hypothetical protein [Treponema sp.]
MKKFLVFLVFIIALGVTGFFLGWAHLTVPPGSYGVMRSKIYGLDDQVIRDGEFRWLWYKLIPTNVEISVFTIEQVRRSFRNSGSLPSGQVYVKLVGIDADFSWEVAGDFFFSVRPETLPELVAREIISDDAGLRRAEGDIAARIETLIVERLKAYADNEDEVKLESLILTGTLPDLNREIERAFPEIENLNCTIRTVRYPDFELYRSVKGLYREYLQIQSASLDPAVISEAERRIDSRTRIDELTQYGELLTRYPVLLEYLALEKSLLQADD